MSELRAVLLTTDYPPRPGGIARLLGELVRGTGDTVHWRVLDVRAELTGRREIPATGWHATRWLRAGADRLVVCGHPYLAAPAVAMARLAGAPLGSLAYGRELVCLRPAHHVALRALRHSDRVVAISRHTARCAHGLGVAEDRLRVVPPLFRPSWTGQVPTTAPARGQRAARDRDHPSERGLQEHRAAPAGDPGARADRRDRAHDDRRRRPTAGSALRARARALGVADRCEFTGHVGNEQLAVLAGSAHVGVFPSRDSIAERGFEGFGLVVVELAAAGMPILVADAAGAVDAAEPEWSMLLDPDDLRAWVEAFVAARRRARPGGDGRARLRVGGDTRLASHRAALR